MRDRGGMGVERMRRQITRVHFAQLVNEARTRTGNADDSVESVWLWALQTQAHPSRVMQELLDTLSPEREVSGGPQRYRGATGADIQYHGAPING